MEPIPDPEQVPEPDPGLLFPLSDLRIWVLPEPIPDPEPVTDPKVVQDPEPVSDPVLVSNPVPDSGP
jgi:outer membrane protein insertion porin family